MSDFLRTFRSAFRKYSYIFPFMLLFVFLPVQWQRLDTDRDTRAYYLAAERIRSNEPLYEPHPPPGPHVVEDWYYLYPPFLAGALAMGPDISFPTFARFWLLVVLSAYWLFSASLGRMVLGRTTLEGTLVAGAAMSFVPGVMNALNMGQADALVWAMVGLSLAYMPARGVGFMAAALTKVNGIWPLMVAVWREGRIVAVTAGVTAAIACLVAVMALGPAEFVSESMDWFINIVPVLSQGQIEPGPLSAALHIPLGARGFDLPKLLPHNLSVPFAPLLAAHSLGLWTPEPGNLPFLLRLYLSGTAFAAPVAAGWVFRKEPVDLHCALVLSAALLFSPILRPTSIPLLILPLVLLYSQGRLWGGLRKKIKA